MVTIDVENESPHDEFLVMKKYNHKLRKNLAKNLNELKDPREKIISLRKFFAKDFEYDYQYAYTDTYELEWRNFHINGKEYRSQSDQNSLDELPPSVYLTKIGRCGIYSSEVDYLLQKNSIKNKKATKLLPCLNIYNKQLERTLHRYNQAEVEINKKKKLINIDICALIFERDAKAQNLDIDYSKLHELNTQF